MSLKNASIHKHFQKDLVHPVLGCVWYAAVMASFISSLLLSIVALRHRELYEEGRGLQSCGLGTCCPGKRVCTPFCLNLATEVLAHSCQACHPSYFGQVTKLHDGMAENLLQKRGRKKQKIALDLDARKITPAFYRCTAVVRIF